MEESSKLGGAPLRGTWRLGVGRCGSGYFFSIFMNYRPTGERELFCVLVAEDHPLMKEGVVQLVESQEDLLVCGVVDSVEMVWGGIEVFVPDLLLLDLRLGEDDTLGLIEELSSVVPELPVLVFSQCEGRLFAERALRLGARGYVMKQEDAEEVLRAIRAVLGGGRYVSHEVVRQLLPGLRGGGGAGRDGGRLGGLTAQEYRVFYLLGGGAERGQIAEELGMSCAEVGECEEAIARKLDVEDGEELASCAAEWVREQFLATFEEGVGGRGG